jgi:hypothetical protein
MIKIAGDVMVMEDSKVAVLLEDIKAQFHVFGEGLQMVNEKVDKGFQEMKEFREEVNTKFDQNHREHQLMMQMIKELSEEQIKLKRAK